MKYLLGWAASIGVTITAAAAQGQALPPMKIDPPSVVRVSDVGGPYGPYAAMPADAGPVRVAPLLPPQEIYAILRESGFSPLGAPQQRGLVYTVSAIDQNGEDGRMVIDARSGRILRFIPAWRMGDRMGEEMATRYGPAGPPPELPQYRRAPAPSAPLPRVVSRSSVVPLPKAMPPRAVATPAKPVVAAPAVAVPPPAPAAAAPAPAQQSAVAAPKPGEVRVIPLTAAPAAVAPVPPAAAEAKPADAPAPAAPPAQGLE